MANILNDDFIDFLQALNRYTVRYLIVGGYAVIYHGYNRTTGDLDIWIEPSEENYQKMILAFSDFGLPTSVITQEKFLNLSEFDVFTFGRPPVCIEILTAVKGLIFNETYKNSTLVLYDNIEVRMIDIRDLITAKKSVSRAKDMDDLEHLISE